MATGFLPITMNLGAKRKTLRGITTCACVTLVYTGAGNNQTIQSIMTLIMQNKANFQNGKMNVSTVKTMNYEQITMNNANEKQTQTKPIFVPLVLFIVYNCLQVLRI